LEADRYVSNGKKTGIFGGTFNPPHVGHFLLARDVQKQFDLDRIFFVPSNIPPHKQKDTVAGASYREAMVKALISGEPDFVLSDYETSKDGISYSIDTIKYFLSEFPDRKFYFITGSDSFYYIDTWKDSAKILELIEFIVFIRKDFSKEKIISKFPDLKNIHWANLRLIDIAASDLRMRIKNGDNVREEVGKEVWEYIDRNGLYK
jgi:nicotinate-nucleotide adenylyltransferase